VNILSAARLFLFGARDVWFVVALPVFLTASLGWDYCWVGAFLAAWVIGWHRAVDCACVYGQAQRSVAGWKSRNDPVPGALSCLTQVA
jgi:hypothetical protein